MSRTSWRLCALIAATANAWVLLVGVVRDPRYLPAEGGPNQPSGPDPSGAGMTGSRTSRLVVRDAISANGLGTEWRYLVEQLSYQDIRSIVLVGHA
jgi:hypothetical protein